MTLASDCRWTSFKTTIALNSNAIPAVIMKESRTCKVLVKVHFQVFCEHTPAPATPASVAT
jgi:hypothetical protein